MLRSQRFVTRSIRFLLLLSFLALTACSASDQDAAEASGSAGIVIHVDGSQSSNFTRLDPVATPLVTQMQKLLIERGLKVYDLDFIVAQTMPPRAPLPDVVKLILNSRAKSAVSAVVVLQISAGAQTADKIIAPTATVDMRVVAVRTLAMLGSLHLAAKGDSIKEDCESDRVCLFEKQGALAAGMAVELATAICENTRPTQSDGRTC
jgi:hypothetical protein